jgi:hypothetical protein
VANERVEDDLELERLLASDDTVFIEEEAEVEAAPPPPPPPFPEAEAVKHREQAWESLAQRLRPGGMPPSRAPRRAATSLRALLELALTVLGLVALNVLWFPLDPGFRRAEFNPFFLPGLLLGLRYGTLIGFAGGALSALWVAGPWRGPVEELAWVQPGLMAALGIAAGALSRGQGGRLSHYRSRSRGLEAQRAALRSTVEAKDAVIRDLQAKIEESGISMRRLYRLSRGMSSGEPQDLSRALLEILARDVRARRASVWVVEGKELRLLATCDTRPAPAPFAPRRPADEGLPGLALRLDRSVSCADPEAAGLAGPGVLAGVVGGGHPALVVWVEDLPLIEFGPAVEARFRALLEWAAESRARSRGSVFDAALGAYRPEYLAEALEREIGRSRRHGTPLRLLLVRLLGGSELADSERKAARAALARALSGKTRETDVVCGTDDEDTFAVVLPMCSTDARAAFFARLSALARRTPSAPFSRLAYSEAVMNGHPVNAELLVKEARRGLQR